MPYDPDTDSTLELTPTTKTEELTMPTTTHEEINMLRDTFNRAFDAFSNTITEHSELSAEVRSLVAQVEAYAAEVKGLRDEVAKAASHNEWLTAELSSARNERDTSRREAENLRNDLTEVQIQRDNLADDLKTEQGTSARHWDSLNRERERTASLTSEVATLKDQLAATEANLQHERETNQHLQEKIAYMEARYDEVTATSEARSKALADAQDEISRLKATIATIEEHNTLLKTEVEELVSDKSKAMGDIAELESSLDEAEAGLRVFRSVFSTIGEAVSRVQAPQGALPTVNAA